MEHILKINLTSESYLREQGPNKYVQIVTVLSSFEFNATELQQGCQDCSRDCWHSKIIGIHRAASQ